MDELLVLGLDSSTGVCSVALVGMSADPARSNVLARRSTSDGKAHAKVLLRLVDEALEEAGHGPSDLRAVVVGAGPGTFTGVRVTVATGRALSLALSVPVLGVSSLAALAAGALTNGAAALDGRPSAETGSVRATRPRAGNSVAGHSGANAESEAGLLVPLIDARRGQLFYALYRACRTEIESGRALWRRLSDFKVCDRQAVGGIVEGEAFGKGRSSGGAHSVSIGHKIILVGDEAARPLHLPGSATFVCTGLEAENLLCGQELLDEPDGYPRGSRLAPWLVKVLARGRASEGSWQEVGSPGAPESVTPIYVRSPDADIHITRMKDPWAATPGGGDLG